MNNLGFGIDFGTTNSIAAVCNNKTHKIERLTNTESNRPYPSVVWYALNRLPIVGDEAKHHIMKYEKVPGNQFVRSIKRQLGKTDGITVFGNKKPVHEIAAEIFRHIKATAKNRPGGYDIKEAVVTIPIDYGGEARKELRRAAEAAGIFIKTLVHEPFAAVVGYCFQESKGLAIDSLSNRTFLVFDWGGGTLDITLVRIDKKGMIELSNAGINDHSGDHFDNILSHCIKNRLAEKHQVDPRELSFSPADDGVLLEECERRKIELSVKDSATIEAHEGYRLGGRSYHISEVISRKDLEQLIEQDVDEAVGAMREVLEKARVPIDSVDQVLLIGGSSRIPLVQKKLLEIFGSRIENVKNADSIIAEGAAVVDAIDLKPVFSGDISIELSDKSLYKVFKHGRIVVPDGTKRSVTLYCTDPRDGEARLIIQQSDQSDTIARVKSKEVLCIPVDSGLPKPYQHERVQADFEMDNDLVLQVSGKAATQEERTSLEMHRLSFGLYLGAL